MIEKFKEIFKNKDKKVENLIFLLIILIITLVCINYIMRDDEGMDEKEKYKNAVLASSSEITGTELENRIENILNKIDGVGEVSVLLTYDDEKLEGIVVVAEGANNLDIKILKTKIH